MRGPGCLSKVPKNVAPPYQTVVHFPHSAAQGHHTVEESQLYKDTYLGTPPDYGTIAERDETIQQADDLRLSVDYLETRDDINHEKLGFFAISWGGQLFPILAALETRFRASAICSGGCDTFKVCPKPTP